MKKIIPKPVNWQDFESLCKKLWGEIWMCPGIKKNGRVGQSQHGVDIYGRPDNKTNYFGIQCKGKDNYLNNKLNVDEIDAEIMKAKSFKPQLECFIFATTSNKDAKIEEYIREKDIESKKNNSFAIELYSWEDIADLIEENKHTFNWYVKKVSFKDLYKISVIINDKEDSIELNPKYIKNIINVTTKNRFNNEAVLETINNKILGHNLIHKIKIINKEIDYSIVPLKIEMYNTGNITLEYIKLFIEFESEKVKLFKSNIINRIDYMDILKIRNYHIGDTSFSYRPDNNSAVLVQKMAGHSIFV